MVKNVGWKRYMVVTCAPLTVWDDTPTRLVKPASFNKYLSGCFDGPGSWNKTDRVPSLWAGEWVRNEVE